MNYTLIKMVQFWFIDKNLNLSSTFVLRFASPKISHFLPCFLYIGNINKLEIFHDTSGLIFMSNKFPGFRNILLVIELHIFAPLKHIKSGNETWPVQSNEKNLHFLISSLRFGLYRSIF